LQNTRVLHQHFPGVFLSPFMRTTLLILAAIVTLATACKTKQQGSGCCSNHQAGAVGQTSGKVSHEYKADGCNTIIIVASADGGEDQILIPSNQLAKEFDKDGLEIKFNFRLLKMPNPEGCVRGNVAEITDISK